MTWHGEARKVLAGHFEKSYNHPLIGSNTASCRFLRSRLTDKEFDMAFHFLSHSWQVKDLADGIMVAISQQELDPSTIAVLDEELLELVMESGQSSCYM